MDAYWGDLEEIELLRKQLYQVVVEHQGDLLHPVVVHMSQQLDRCIVAYERTR